MEHPAHLLATFIDLDSPTYCIVCLAVTHQLLRVGMNDESRGPHSLNLRREFPSAQLFLTSADDLEQDRQIPYFRGYIRERVKASNALEIGPSYNPILPKKDGYNVVVLDHEDQNGLRKKYANSPVDVTNIEPVDVVWRSGTLGDAIAGRKFDSIVASHVIEHAPDFIQFLQDCHGALTDAGILFLIVPDKRYCFDLFQPVSDTAKILGDHLIRRTRHSFESFYRYSMIVSQDGRGDWSQHATKAIRFINVDPKQSIDNAKRSFINSDYMDTHENYFTPLSLTMILDELRYLGELEFCIDVLTRSRGCEFLVVLKKSDANQVGTLDRFIARKLAMVFLRMSEDQEMIAYTLGSVPR
jgi:2-polyprenyl-3-methyl-5-hydroxy-6-metoxy-1,4-benzoquinol methylase